VSCILSESGKTAAFPREAETLRRAVSEVINADYETRMAEPNFPPASSATWYIFAPDISQLSKTAPARKIWEDGEGNLYIESIFLGNTTDWIGHHYGEESAIQATRMDFSDFSTVRKELASRFPLFDKDLREYEGMLADVSQKYGVELRMRYDSGKGVAILYMNAKIKTKGLDLQAKIEKVRLNVRALQEALGRVHQYEAGRPQQKMRRGR